MPYLSVSYKNQKVHTKIPRLEKESDLFFRCGGRFLVPAFVGAMNGSTDWKGVLCCMWFATRTTQCLFHFLALICEHQKMIV
jgi:hypothetical protein